MTSKLTFAPEIEREVLDATVWYESQKEGLGVDFVRALDESFAAIAAVPGAGAPWHEYRKRGVRRFPYVIFYRVVDDELVEITAVGHMSRRPGYWLGR